MLLDIIEIILLLGLVTWLVFNRNELTKHLFNRRRKLIIDSCGLIDGRIAEIVRSGFMVDELVIPQFVLNELQTLADGRDAHKRERARYGLDIANELQDGGLAQVTVDRTLLSDIKATDDKLVALSKNLNAELYTTDFNLSKVASVEGVRVLNVNELAQSLRPIALPGETLELKVIQKGSNRDQGVGYLEDGTMIVIEGGAKFVGWTVPVVVSRMHQTVAGKMVFGQVKKTPKASSSTSKNTSNKQHHHQNKSDSGKRSVLGRLR